MRGMQDADIAPEIVDARGLFCPEPLVLARRALKQHAAGRVLEVWATDPLASLDIEALCARGACVYLGCRSDGDGIMRIRIEAR